MINQLQNRIEELKKEIIEDNNSINYYKEKGDNVMIINFKYRFIEKRVELKIRKEQLKREQEILQKIENLLNSYTDANGRKGYPNALEYYEDLKRELQE